MYCKPSTLKTALSNYMGYLPTASEHLRETRAFWIPIGIQDAATKHRVRHIAEDILAGTLQTTLGDSNDPYTMLEPDLQIAVALCAIQGWADHLDGKALQERHNLNNHPLDITVRLGQFLAYIPLDHATLAIRNWGIRDGGKIASMKIIQDGCVTRDANWMRVYINTRNRWHQRGYDWNRRRQEEAQLA